MKSAISRIAGVAVVMAALSLSSAWGQLPTETAGQSEVLDPPDAHRIYVHKMTLADMMLSKVMVIDLDTQEFLGQVTGGFLPPIALSPDGDTFYTADAFFSRGVRGERTDVLTAWNTQTLGVRFEVEIPSKRISMLPERWGLRLSDDGRFAYIFNFTPATSVSVVDLKKREFVGEIPVPGCFLVYPTGDRTFASLCGDGSLQQIRINDAGQVVSRSRTRFFDPNEVDMYSRAVRVDDTYYFLTVKGRIQTVDVSGDKIKVGERWSLFTQEQREAGWGVGGWQLMTIAPALDRLYVLVMPNWKRYKWEYPSDTIWVYDLHGQEKIGELKAPTPMISLRATTDDNPLLVGGNMRGGLEIFDLGKGKHIATMEGVGKFPFALYSH